jgi:hypothetical protein
MMRRGGSQARAAKHGNTFQLCGLLSSLRCTSQELALLPRSGQPPCMSENSVTFPRRGEDDPTRSKLLLGYTCDP